MNSPTCSNRFVEIVQSHRGSICQSINQSISQSVALISVKQIVTDYNFTMYEGRSVCSRTVLLIKHQANTEYRKYSEVVPPLMYTTYRGFIYDVSHTVTSLLFRCKQFYNFVHYNNNNRQQTVKINSRPS